MHKAELVLLAHWRAAHPTHGLPAPEPAAGPTCSQAVGACVSTRLPVNAMEGARSRGEWSCRGRELGSRGGGCMKTEPGNRCTMSKRAGERMGKDVRSGKNDSLCFREQRREG